MPVNTAALKTFAPAMRRQLLEAVGRKLDLLLNSQTPDTLSTYAKQIGELREQEAENREQLLERVGYTWFNRLCALRYLDARGWHPFGCKVLMPAADGETQPELLKLMRAGNLPAGLQAHVDESRLHGLLDSQIQPSIANTDPQGEVYRELVLATSRFYHKLLPNLFEALDDATELLLPDDLLTEGSIAGAFRSEISDDDCQDVEIIGWLYQFYISEKKDAVMARKKAVPAEDIPAVTQLFTPHWIVRYLVENSLGRLWLLNRPGSKLREHMPYYIEGDAETDFLVINKPEEIKLMDPACGSGHMLTYAFDLLTMIYEEEGYSPNEISALILRNNLYGLEICPRAAQLAGLALILKAREQSRRFFQVDQLERPQIIELQDVRFEEGELNDYIEALDLSELFDPNLFKLLHQFDTAKNIGSLIQPCLDERAISNARKTIEEKELGNQLTLSETHSKALCVLEEAEALTQRYQVVVANPPYMGRGTLNPNIASFADALYPRSSSDCFAMFAERARNLALKGGWLGFVTPFAWMFIRTYEAFRKDLLEHTSIQSLVQLEYNAFEPACVPVCTFVLHNLQAEKRKGVFIRLSEFRGFELQPTRTLQAIQDQQCAWRYHTEMSRFQNIPGQPIAYWFSSRLTSAFTSSKALGELAEIKSGLSTGDNELFLRFWHEVNANKINFSCRADTGGNLLAKWVPYNKGGPFRKWYGNTSLVLNWGTNGDEMRKHGRAVFRNPNYYFLRGLTWSGLTSSTVSFRKLDDGFVFDSNKGAMIFPVNSNREDQLLGLLNSKVAHLVFQGLNPTLSTQVGDIERLPFIECRKATEHVLQLNSLARADWDNFEISWNFIDLPMLRPELKGPTLKISWRNWEAQASNTIRRMQELETENNRLFIGAYGLENELQPEVTEEEVTLARADQRNDIAAFLSYATGCMMGRYSLDQPSLILADSRDSQAEQLAAYEEKVGKRLSEVQFKPDPDGIIPVLDGEWFEDDIVARTREFLTVTFPESSVGENLRFIEESLGKDVRKYFCSEFYKDHLQTYKKRPIYWMVQSPKKGFSCLIYLHRYTKDTLNQVLNNYFRPYLQKLEARLAQLGLDQLNDDLPTRERTAARKEAEKITKVLKECQAWEQDALLPLAQQRIELDLDDGVKVNYLKLQDVLAPIPGLAAKEE